MAKINRYYAGVAPAYVLIAREHCDTCGAHANWPHALICYNDKQRKELEKNAAGKCL